MAFNAEVNRVDVETDDHEKLPTLGNIGESGVTGLLFSTYLTFIHNAVGLWVITVELNSAVTMLHMVIIRKKLFPSKQNELCALTKP